MRQEQADTDDVIWTVYCDIPRFKRQKVGQSIYRQLIVLLTCASMYNIHYSPTHLTFSHPHTNTPHILTPTHLTFSHPHTSHSHTHTPHILTPSPPRTAGVWQRQGDLHLYVHCSSSLQLPSLYLCCTLSVVRGVV